MGNPHLTTKRYFFHIKIFHEYFSNSSFSYKFFHSPFCLSSILMPEILLQLLLANCTDQSPLSYLETMRSVFLHF